MLTQILVFFFYGKISYFFYSRILCGRSTVKILQHYTLQLFQEKNPATHKPWCGYIIRVLSASFDSVRRTLTNRRGLHFAIIQF